jgi:cell division protein FtsN
VSGSGIAAIAVGAIVILAGISFFIWRDARRRAPVKPGAAVAATGSGSKPRPKSRKLSPAERRRRKRGRAR